MTDPNDMDNSQNKIQQTDFNMMISNVYAWVKNNKGKSPAIVYIVTNGVKTATYLSIVKFNSLHTIWDNFITANNRLPNFIYINQPPTKPGLPAATVGTDLWVKQTIEYHSGVFITSKEVLYALGKNMIYADFENLKHTKVDAVDVEVWSNGINCAEFCEYIAKPILNVLGFVAGTNYWIAHGYVTCSNGNSYGHYWIVFTDTIIINAKTSPVNLNFYDLAGDAEVGRPQGTLICNEGQCYIDRYQTDITS